MRKVLLIILLAAAVNMAFGTCGDHGMGKMVFMTGDAQASAVFFGIVVEAVSYTHLRAHETVLDLVCRLLLEKKKKTLQKKNKHHIS